jgi:hypothetical protein
MVMNVGVPGAKFFGIAGPWSPVIVDNPKALEPPRSNAKVPPQN